MKDVLDRRIEKELKEISGKNRYALHIAEDFAGLIICGEFEDSQIKSMLRHNGNFLEMIVDKWLEDEWIADFQMFLQQKFLDDFLKRI